MEEIIDLPICLQCMNLKEDCMCDDFEDDEYIDHGDDISIWGYDGDCK